MHLVTFGFFDSNLSRGFRDEEEKEFFTPYQASYESETSVIVVPFA